MFVLLTCILFQICLYLYNLLEPTLQMECPILLMLLKSETHQEKKKNSKNCHSGTNKKLKKMRVHMGRIPPHFTLFSKLHSYQKQVIMAKFDLLTFKCDLDLSGRETGLPNEMPSPYLRHSF